MAALVVQDVGHQAYGRRDDDASVYREHKVINASQVVTIQALNFSEPEST